jgi:putative endonuclease
VSGARADGHFVYLARAADGAYYCGYALDPAARIRTHNAGRGAKSLRGKTPVRLAFAQRFASKGAALSFEASLKRRSHAFKQTLSRRWSNRRKRKA